MTNTDGTVKLSEESLKYVAGGFTSSGKYTSGMEVSCFHCGNADSRLFESFPVETREGDYYRCLNCGYQFYLYPNGTSEDA